MLLTTIIDKLAESIKGKKKATFREVAKEIGLEENQVERIALILQKHDLAVTHYPANMISPPWVGIKDAPEEKETQREGKKIEEYVIPATQTHATGSVTIAQSTSERRPIYTITKPRVSPYTRAYVESLKMEIAKGIPFKITDGEEDINELFAKRNAIKQYLLKDLPLGEEALELLSDLIVNEMYGLGELELLIGDSRLEEIVVNESHVPVAVYHRKYGWMRTNIFLRSEDSTRNFSEQIARKVGRQISTLTPILDAHLANGDRVNSTLFPISTKGNTITLRLFARNPWTIVSYLKKEHNTMSVEMAALLWQALHYEMNVIVAGGTASGKTSALNGMLALTPPFQRIVTIEDTRELVLPSYQWNWVPLATRMANPEGLGEITMLDLVVNALRMRPDRIVMGEIRRKREAEVLFEAMHTGHSVYATIHADTGSQVIKRLIEPPIEVPPSEVEDIDLLLIQYRDRRRNLRRTLEISEVVPGVEMPELNRVFTWRPRTDSFQAVKPAHKFMEKVNLHTGLTEKEILDDRNDKQSILEWMAKNNLDDVDNVGKVMQIYYSEPDTLADAAKKNAKPAKVMGS